MLIFPASSPGMDSSRFPTERVTISQPLNPSIGVSELHRILRLYSCEIFGQEISAQKNNARKQKTVEFKTGREQDKIRQPAGHVGSMGRTAGLLSCLCASGLLETKISLFFFSHIAPGFHADINSQYLGIMYPSLARIEFAGSITILCLRKGKCFRIYYTYNAP